MRQTHGWLLGAVGAMTLAGLASGRRAMESLITHVILAAAVLASAPPASRMVASAPASGLPHLYSRADELPRGAS